jgi:hypothetical protein
MTMVLLMPGTSGAATKHASVRMPSLVGHNRAQVFAIMRRDGLYFVTKGPGAAESHWLEVLSQSPKAGTVIAWHGEAILHVTNQSPTGPRRVPRLIGLSRARAFQAMRRAQLYFKTVGTGSSSHKWRLVLAQSPAPGTLVPWHSQIILRVAITQPLPPKKKAPAKSPGVVISGSGYKVGVATWYNYVPGHCATWYLPKGTQITVRDLTTGKSITCIITDREDEEGKHVVDLSETQFSELAPLTQGVIDVKVSW